MSESNMSERPVSLCRSALFMPASNERVLAKGVTLDCDAVIVDLEDSVAPDAKDASRRSAAAALTEQDYGFRLRALRVNAVDTEWHADDLQAAVVCKPDVLVLPKVDSADDIAKVSAVLDAQALDCELWAMIETPVAVLHVEEIAASVRQHTRLTRLVAGANDLARTVGMPISRDRHYLLPWLMQCVAAAKAYGLQILDGIYNDFTDSEGFAAECHAGVMMGMDGKTLIHPMQIAPANAAWTPSAEQLNEAREIVTTFAQPQYEHAGVVQINGRMVERLHLEMAQRALAIASDIARRGEPSTAMK